MNLDLEGRAALVTGASRGIGRAIAETLAAEGCDVLLAARSADDLAGVAADIAGRTGRRAVAQAGDLRQAAAVTAAVDAAVAAFGRIDILVNCAGATKRGDFFALTDADFEDGFALKFHAAVRLTRAAWPHLKARQGAIINIIGIGGRNANPEFTIGGPVNAAFFNFTKAVAQIGTRDGIRVNAISPGSFETGRLTMRIELIAETHGLSLADARAKLLADDKLPRYGDPREIGRLAAFLVSNQAGFIHGAIIDIDGGATKAI